MKKYEKPIMKTVFVSLERKMMSTSETLNINGEQGEAYNSNGAWGKEDNSGEGFDW